METAANDSERPETATAATLRFIPVGEALSEYLREKYGVIIPEKTIRGRHTRPPPLQVMYLFEKPYTTPQWADEWLWARLRDQPAQNRSGPRPPIAAKLREQFCAEEAEIRAEISIAKLTERERSGMPIEPSPT
jgi:hypothetical protein